MIDLYLNNTTNDIELDQLNNWRLVQDEDLVAQRLRQRLSTHIGEWLFNIEIGVDYLGQVFVKNPRENVIRAMFVAVTLATPGVDRIDELEFEVQGRRLYVTLRVVSGDEVITVAGAEQGTDFLWFQL